MGGGQKEIKHVTYDDNTMKGDFGSKTYFPGLLYLSRYDTVYKCWTNIRGELY